MVLSFDGSTRIWLKYIGRALQLLISVQVLPLSSERSTPPSAGSRAGATRGAWFACPAWPWPPARPKPLFGPALLHQSYWLPRPPPPPPAAAFAAGCCAAPACPRPAAGGPA